ncbi:MAG TPA: response regulator transcription factor [Ktedonobacterales bacterium]|nr:response regulator transcription factor [Ktedonobacterales bacterium]
MTRALAPLSERIWGDSLNILVVDSDRDMVEMLVGLLRARGHTVHCTFSADRIRSSWETHKPDLVILDVSMPGVDSLAMCRDLQSQHDALILAVTTEHDPQMYVQCLESGADAFLTKPFMPKQLLANLHALKRRVRSTLQRQPSSVMVAGPIHFDASRNEVKVDGRSSRLTPTESRILQLLVANTGDVCTLNQIVSHAWGYGDDGDTYLIKAHIRHLREKIEKEPSKPRFIRTVPGVGYTLSAGGAPSTGDNGGSPPNGGSPSRMDARVGGDVDDEVELSDTLTDDELTRFNGDAGEDSGDEPFREAL